MRPESRDYTYLAKCRIIAIVLICLRGIVSICPPAVKDASTSWTGSRGAGCCSCPIFGMAESPGSAISKVVDSREIETAVQKHDQLLTLHAKSSNFFMEAKRPMTQCYVICTDPLVLQWNTIPTGTEINSPVRGSGGCRRDLEKEWSAWYFGRTYQLKFRHLADIVVVTSSEVNCVLFCRATLRFIPSLPIGLYNYRGLMQV